MCAAPLLRTPPHSTAPRPSEVRAGIRTHPRTHPRTPLAPTRALSRTLGPGLCPALTPALGPARSTRAHPRADLQRVLKPMKGLGAPDEAIVQEGRRGALLHARPPHRPRSTPAQPATRRLSPAACNPTRTRARPPAPRPRACAPSLQPPCGLQPWPATRPGATPALDVLDAHLAASGRSYLAGAGGVVRVRVPDGLRVMVRVRVKVRVSGEGEGEEPGDSSA